MADEQQQDSGGEPDGQDGQPSPWGRVLDGIGVLAAVVLVVIAADIWTDGRLISRRLTKRRGEGEDVERAS